MAGGGSAGFSFCYQLLKMLKNNEKVILVEKNGVLGGVATEGGVNTWEPGVAGDGVHQLLATQLLKNKQAGIGKTIGRVTKHTPYGYSKILPNESYQSTLKRSGLQVEQMRRFHFEPKAMSTLMLSMLSSYQNLTILFECELVNVVSKDDSIKKVIVRHVFNHEEYEIEADFFTDCTGDIVLSRLACCDHTSGEDGFDRYQEPSAPVTPTDTLNGVSKIMRITKTSTHRKYKMPMEYINDHTRKWMEQIKTFKIVPVINEYPNGDLNINLLPTMDGREYQILNGNDREYYLNSRLYAYFEFLTKQIGFDDYKIAKIFKTDGVRESYRLIGRYVLKEQDVLQGTFNDSAICYADHALDIHGKNNTKAKGAIEISSPYGIPKECVLTKEYNNLIVACRGASFSHIVASSCRLSRTMMALGENSAKIAYYAFIHHQKL